MTDANGNSIDVNRLREMYRTEVLARAAFDIFADRQKNSTTMKVERLQFLLGLQGLEASRGQVVEFFKQLAEGNCGEFVLGRKGHSSRFEWSVGLISAGQVAAGKLNQVERLAEVEVSPEPDDDPDELEHRFMLRPDFEVELVLPQDLTASEAGRLADYVRTLPFH